MSCISGIINLDGAPIDPAWLTIMTSAMQARAPDGLGVQNLGSAGLGHSLLDLSGPTGPVDRQPTNLGGQLWITANARLDGRKELIDKLSSHGQIISSEATDATLILHAYQAFGDRFLNCLLGDFVFALWDAHQQKLICARDHLGIRPFFYYFDSNVFVFASDIDALLLHPAVSRKLDDCYIADFLLLGVSTEPQRTIYQHIKRLPAASCLYMENGRLSIQRYWSLPEEPEFWHGSVAEAQARFAELLQIAVSDRVRTRSVAIELSGGLDSGTIAAELAKLRQSQPLTIQAYTNHSPHLLHEDKEAHFANLTGAHLDIPLVLGQCEGALFEDCTNTALKTGEPCSNPDLAYYHRQRMQMQSQGAKVLLSGQAGDSLFTGSPHYYQRLLQQLKLGQTVFELFQCLYHGGSIRGLGIRSALFGNNYPQPGVVPPWIQPDYAARIKADKRWAEGWHAWNSADDTCRQFQAPWMSAMLESYDTLKSPIEVRHPFCDIRLVEFMLSIPRHLTLDKRILREAMRGRLPEAVRRRPKTPLAGDHFQARLIQPAFRAGLAEKLTQAGQHYIDKDVFLENFALYCQAPKRAPPWASWQMLTPIALDAWLTLNP